MRVAYGERERIIIYRCMCRRGSTPMLESLRNSLTDESECMVVTR